MADNHFSVGAPYYVAPVDSFQNASSYYGTLQQGGNVWEWTEDWQYGIVGSRGLRGGSWSYTLYGLNATNMDPGGLDYSGYVFGARLCMSDTDKGWQPVKARPLTCIYEYIMLMSQKRLFLFSSVCAFLSILGITGVLYVAFRFIRKIIK